MDILYVNAGKNKIGNDLLGILHTHIGNKNIRIYGDILDFSKILRQNQQEITIVVIFIADEEDLLKLYIIKHLLHSVITILILPDRERDTIALGFRCKPYFVTFINNDMNEIVHTIRALIQQPFRSTIYSANKELQAA